MKHAALALAAILATAAGAAEKKQAAPAKAAGAAETVSTVPGHAGTGPAEVWLTKERADYLRRVTSRPYISSREKRADGTEILRWGNGAREWVSTNRPASLLGKKAANGWRGKIEAEAAGKQALIEDLKALKGAIKQANIEALVEKHSKGKTDK